ncbi:MAG: hypothetical protein RMJ15_05180 [Nitrososphaerota archaeon]|nr:hypothetical protein [Nitrososphaerota archaeon]
MGRLGQMGHWDSGTPIAYNPVCLGCWLRLKLLEPPPLALVVFE